MLVLSPLIALAMMARPIFSRGFSPSPRVHKHEPGRRPRRASRLYKPNGKREVARRLRQIQAGQLRVSELNGVRENARVARRVSA
jgi:hypothetical protein